MYYSRMEKIMFRYFCALNLIILISAAGNDGENFGNQQAYNLNSLITKTYNRLQNSFNLKQSPNSVHDVIQFGGNHSFDFQIDVDFQNVSKCAGDIFYTLQNIKQQWALHLFDSFGKPESSILQGNTKFIGDYNECLQVRSSNTNSTIGNFRGRYCSLSMTLSLQNMTMPFPFSVGICVPDSCSSEDFEFVLKLLPLSGPTPTSLTCKPTEKPLNTSAKAVIGLLSVFCALAVLGSSITVFDYCKKILKESKESSLIVNISELDRGDALKKNEAEDEQLLCNESENKNKGLEALKTFLGCFCIFTNGAKLLNTDSSEGQLLCIHGIRFLSMSWVILGHMYAFAFNSTRNVIEAIVALDTFAFEVVLQGFYSVDSFFVLSGFLLTYLSMKEFAKTKGKISWLYFYIHRYIRLTPVYMIVLGFSATVYLYLGSGPFWPDNDVDANCRDYWWWNILYINNFNDMSKMCMGWSWYLANDMQFFVISPIFMITLWRWPKVGYGLLGIFWCACCLSNFFITYHFNLNAGLGAMIGNPNMGDFMKAMSQQLEYMDKIYIKPYTRISPYLIGILVGYLLFKRKASNQPKHSLVVLCCGWIVAATVSLASVYGLYHHYPDTVASSFYNALHRTAFSVGLAWVIYVCLIGQGGVVNSILSYKLFIPLSRLTYAAYLIHPMIITGYYVQLKTSFEFSQSSMVVLFLGMMVVTYGLALPVSLVLESPIVSLEKIIRKHFSRKESS